MGSHVNFATELHCNVRFAVKSVHINLGFLICEMGLSTYLRVLARVNELFCLSCLTNGNINIRYFNHLNI